MNLLSYTYEIVGFSKYETFITIEWLQKSSRNLGLLASTKNNTDSTCMRAIASLHACTQSKAKEQLYERSEYLIKYVCKMKKGGKINIPCCIFKESVPFLI